MSEKGKLAIGASFLMFFCLSAASLQKQRWILPVADGGDVDPSPPSMRGFLIMGTKDNTITLKRDSPNARTRTAIAVRLTTKTQFFTVYGGLYFPKQLRPGQYVWVWYTSADPTQAGTPPRAAVVILWSTDPSDKPSAEVRRSYDKHR